MDNSAHAPITSICSDGGVCKQILKEGTGAIPTKDATIYSTFIFSLYHSIALP